MAKGVGFMVPFEVEYGVYGDLIVTCPTPYSIYLRGTNYRGLGLRPSSLRALA